MVPVDPFDLWGTGHPFLLVPKSDVSGAVPISLDRYSFWLRRGLPNPDPFNGQGCCVGMKRGLGPQMAGNMKFTSLDMNDSFSPPNDERRLEFQGADRPVGREAGCGLEDDEAQHEYPHRDSHLPSAYGGRVDDVKRNLRRRQIGR